MSGKAIAVYKEAAGRTMKRELRKDQILECAKRLFSQRGYYQTHIETILKEAKIGKGTFYLYFKNKQDLFISLLIKFLDEWEDAVLSTSTELEKEDMASYFKTFIKRSFQFFRQNEDLCNIYLRIGPGTDEAFEPFIERFEEKMLQYVINKLEEGVQSNIFRKGIDIEKVANMLLGAFLRLDYYYFVLRKKSRESFDIDKTADQFFDFIMSGLRVEADKM